MLKKIPCLNQLDLMDAHLFGELFFLLVRWKLVIKCSNLILGRA
nr:hypothetical protein Iba_scaffold14379.3CG0430 [Ipomoea batatas]